MRFHEDDLTVRDARDAEREIMRKVTLAAYREYAAIVPRPFWRGYRQHLLATLDAERAVDRIVAERHGVILGSVLLYPPAADAHGGMSFSASWPEVRLLAVVPAARRRGVGTALMEECVCRARRAGATVLGLHTMDFMRAAARVCDRMGFMWVPESNFTPAPGVVVKAYRLDLVR